MSNNDKGSLIAVIILSTAMVVSWLLNSIEKDKLKSQIEILKKEKERLNKLIIKQNTDICLANQILELSETKKNVIFISCD